MIHWQPVLANTEIMAALWKPDSTWWLRKDASQVWLTWPTAEQLSGYYFRDVEHLDPYPHGSIDICPFS
ncbi:MAG: hypothetical protein R6U93_08275 [Dehalococcoidia bacterium]